MPGPGASKVVAVNFQQNLGSICGVFLILLAPMLLFVVAYRAMGSVVLTSITVLFLASLAPLLSSGGSLTAAALSAGIMLSTASGLHCYYANVFPTQHLGSGKVYLNVFAEQPAFAFADAAILRFADGAVVDDSKAMGVTVLENDADIFCVAPIQDPSSTGRVSFWAVGINCCGREAVNFKCDVSSDGGSLGGPVIPDIGAEDGLWDLFGKHLAPSRMRYDLYLRAVEQAAAVHGLASSERPMLLEASNTKREELIRFGWERVGGDISLCAAICVGAAIIMSIASSSGNKDWQSELLPGADGSARGIGSPGSPVSPAQLAQQQMRRLAQEPASFLERQVLGFILPLLTYIACVLVFSWAPCFRHGTVMLAAIVTTLLITVATLMMARRTFLFGVFLLAATVAGVYTGRWNYFHYTFHTCAINTHRTYKSVLPDVSSAEYADAGKMFFDGSAGLSTNQSVGLLYQGTKHCVAPVVPKKCAISSSSTATSSGAAVSTGAGPMIELFGGSAQAPTAAPVASAPAPAVATPAVADSTGCSSLAHADFWAVGKDCCDWQGNFECFGAGEEDAGAGLIFLNTDREGVVDEELAGYLLAIWSASAVHGLPRPEKPLLMSWGRDPEVLRKKWSDRAVMVIVLSTMMAFFVLFLIANGAVLAGRRSSGEGKGKDHGRDQQRFGSPPRAQFPDEPYRRRPSDAFGTRPVAGPPRPNSGSPVARPSSGKGGAGDPFALPPDRTAMATGAGGGGAWRLFQTTPAEPPPFTPRERTAGSQAPMVAPLGPQSPAPGAMQSTGRTRRRKTEPIH